MKEKLFETIESETDVMVDTLSGLVSIPAISPLSGGKGEYQKSLYILNKLNELGFNDVGVFNSPDPSAEAGVRPSIVVKIKGKTDKHLWIVAHTDVVPAGDLSLWDTDPFKAVVKDGKIYGRGCNDNCQELVSSLYAALALKKLGIMPKYEVCLCFVADEEVGSKHGIRFLIDKGIFKTDDLIIVPDMGTERGDFIEIAEKSICWLEFTAEGQQVHASTPQLGKNACRAANEFSVALDKALHNAFPETDDLFSPICSTFEPTKRLANVPNINTVPGREIFSFDCRVLPTVPLDEVIKVVDAEIKKAEAKLGVRITFSCAQKEQAPEPTPPDAPIVGLLKKSLAQVLPVKIKVGGIGGGTCAAYFRRANLPVAVWGQDTATAHMPNECTRIEHLVNESKVFAMMMLG